MSATKLAAVTLTGLAATLGATAARADNEQTSLYALTCSPYVVNGCASGTSTQPLANGLNIGGGYAFASGYRGGFALASAVFAPGGGPLLQSGLYRNGSIADFSYTFQVQGAPNTLVPLHIFASVSSSAIHLTTNTGQVASLVDGDEDPAPSTQFKVVSNAYLQVSPDRLTPYPNSSAGISVESIYEVNPYDGTYYCKNCDGAGVVLDQTLWVYSNSNINVHLDANMLLEYTAFGSGLDPLNLFGDASAEVDPVFSIDDPAYSAFSIVGVPADGFPPPTLSTAVPEPASWALMLGGFGLLGAALRGRGARPRLHGMRRLATN